MPDQSIFCNSPWYELHIYWDGSLGFCCQESHKIYPDDLVGKYNINNMTIKQWFDSEPMRQARMAMFGDTKNSFCTKCYAEEDLGASSRRHRSNQKSVIFTRTAFDESYIQSPGYRKFETSRQAAGSYDGMPIDLHIDLGNFCNLTCKMCPPSASSRVAAQHVRWGIDTAKKYVGNNWTQDRQLWDRVVSELADIKQLKNVHFMGGETLLTKQFEEFVDYMISKERFDLNFSFVTNGTTFNDDLMEKLSRFNRIGIEVSIESLTDHNRYQRQGTDTQQVLANIDRYRGYCDDQQVTLTVRPAISLLTIGSYHTLLSYCMENKLIVKSLVCYQPRYLTVEILPDSVKTLYQDRYRQFLIDLGLQDVTYDDDYNESDPNQLRRIVKSRAVQAINLLSTPRPTDADQLLEQMVYWCKKWDAVHGYDAKSIYPELAEIFDQHGY